MTDFSCFPLDAILSNTPLCATPSVTALNTCVCVWKFTDVVCSFYCVLYALMFVSILVIWPLIISNQDPCSKNYVLQLVDSPQGNCWCRVSELVTPCHSSDFIMALAWVEELSTTDKLW